MYFTIADPLLIQKCKEMDPGLAFLNNAEFHKKNFLKKYFTAIFIAFQ